MMEAMMERWSDDRLDDLNRKVDGLARRTDNGFNRVDANLHELRSDMNARFEKIEADMSKRFEKVDTTMSKRFEKVDTAIQTMSSEAHVRLDGLQHSMVYAIVTLTGAILAGFAAILVLIATQL
jgi:hypothetical protein